MLSIGSAQIFQPAHAALPIASRSCSALLLIDTKSRERLPLRTKCRGYENCPTWETYRVARQGAMAKKKRHRLNDLHMTQRVAVTSMADGLLARQFSKSRVLSRNRSSETRIFPARAAKVHSESHFQTPTGGKNQSLRPVHSKESTRRIRDAIRQ